MKNSLPVYDLSGKTTGDISLNPVVFNAPAHPHLIHQVVVTFLGNARNVVASTKDRGQVSGTNKKPWKQKGTGNARAGSARSPLWRGGGTTFGPNAQRNFMNRLPHKMKLAAWRGVLTDKVTNDQLIIIDSLDALDGKTKSWSNALSLLAAVLPVFAKKTLIVDGQKSDLADRSIRNIPTTHYVDSSTVTIYDLVRWQTVVVTKSGLEALTERLVKDAPKAKAEKVTA